MDKETEQIRLRGKQCRRLLRVFFLQLLVEQLLKSVQEALRNQKSGSNNCDL